MHKKILALMIGCGMVFSSSLFSFASENESTLATLDVIEEAGITVDDLEEVANSYKQTSEKTDDNEYEKEFKFASAAASLGSCEAMLWMGEMYQGNKIEAAKDVDAIEIAIDWWNKAAESGQPRGYTNIGLLYMHSNVPGGGSDHGDIEYDPETALTYFEKALDLGDFKAPRYIGLCYQDGTGVEVDESKAYEYFSLASENGDSTSALYCAEYLLEGKGIEQDIEKALNIYQEIIDSNAHDTPNAAYALGKIYEEGVYAEADLNKAKEYYQIVVDTAATEDTKNALKNANEALERLQ